MPAVGDLILVDGRRLCEVVDMAETASGKTLVKLLNVQSFLLTGYRRDEWQEYDPDIMTQPDGETVQTHLDAVEKRADGALSRVQRIRKKRGL